MSVADESLAELFEQYKDEVRESIGTLDAELVAIEQDPSNSEVIFSIFRHLHSLKGSSKMFNVENIGHIAHKLEDLMQIIDQDNSILERNSQIVNLLFRGTDIFRDIINRLEEDIGYVNLTPAHIQFVEEIKEQTNRVTQKEDDLIRISKLLLEEVEAVLPSLEETDTENLRRLINDMDASIKLHTSAGDESIKYTYNKADVTPYVTGYETGLAKLKAGTQSEQEAKDFFKNAEDMLKALFEVAEEDIMDVLGELNDGLEMYEERGLEVDAIVTEFFSMLFEDLKAKLKAEAVTAAPEAVVKEEAPAPEKAAPAATSTREAPQTMAKTIRVDEKKIDIFLESVGKLITQSEILNHLQFSFKEAGINPALVRDFASVNRTISNDIVHLQRSLMEVRQVEMDNITKKFPRLVRDISHKMEKEVQLVISGERVPIDKSLLDDVEAAMIHLVRNAIDHGLETPEEREAAGKERRGRIGIGVIQEETSILVEISDNGRGIDFDAVRRRAVERGMVTAEEIEGMTDDDSIWLVFKSGLTTKKEATDISGRGVGLDVVMANIKKWNGEVLVENQPGAGLTIRLRIPITNTLLTKEAILLRLGPTRFCLPLEHVVEIVTVPVAEIHHHKDQALFRHRNAVIHVVDMKANLGMPDDTNGASQKTFIILRGKLQQQKAICADEILGQQKIVIKDFEIDSFRRLPYYQGLTLMGDGRVVLILDAEKIVD